MPKVKISEYSTVNSNNTDINSINIDEGCAPSGINNAIREVMVHLKNWQTNASGDGATFASLVVQGTGSFTGAVTMSAGATLSGTNTLSGSNIMSGNINSSGSTNTFSGTVVMSGANTISHAAGTVSAPSITVNGDSNTGIFFPAADTIAFTEGGVESVRIDAFGNVGVGVTPSAWNSSWKANQVGSYGAVSVLTNQTNLTNNLFYNASNSWVYLNTNAAAIYAQVGGQHIFQSAASGTAGNNVTTLTSVLQVDRAKTLALENASPQSGTGITFPATQSASSDANTLDDYEEGTWTATTSASVTAPTTPKTATGYYTKIGRQVTVISANLNEINMSGSSGALQITGLPFTSANLSGNNSMGSCIFYKINTPTGTVSLAPYIGSNSSVVSFFATVDNTIYESVTDNATTDGRCWFALTYFV